MGTLGATLVLDTSVAQLEPMQRNACLAVLYAMCYGILYDQVLKIPRDRENALRSAQLIVCLTTIYTHVPICFGNVAISFPSAFFWAPWVALPDFASLCQSRLATIAMGLWLVATCIPNMPMDAIFGSSFTAYVCWLYFPIHLLLFLTCALGLQEKPKTEK